MESRQPSFGIPVAEKVECCLHGYKCSIALKTMSTETLTRTQKIDISSSRKKTARFQLQRGESFAKFKFTQLLGQEYICEKGIVSKKSKGEKTKTIEESSAFPLRRYYIGIVTPHTAELFVSRNTAFRIYHSLDEVKEMKLQLCIIYKTSRGDFYHYRIKEQFDAIFQRDILYVDCGEEESPKFLGIEALIKYYSIYASLHSFSSSKGLNIDIFPWWNFKRY
ncbi:unnamed protein product [Thelazia callipaeda]|uniref:60S ribosome subunit biogenesis protein NIP7 homolog n=1 Tax=Thelazia callipaeda TaxID=103827 RepID=A0A0N5D011_THECL|nr:unnamed protein product [Thelazia callipaeda]